MFGPGTTVLHHGSYASFLLLSAILARCLQSLPRLWPAILLLVQTVWFLLVWVISSPANHIGRPNFVLIGLAALFLVSIVRIALAPGTDLSTNKPPAKPTR
jgi:hypothetical protein